MGALLLSSQLLVTIAETRQIGVICDRATAMAPPAWPSSTFESSARKCCQVPTRRSSAYQPWRTPTCKPIRPPCPSRRIGSAQRSSCLRTNRVRTLRIPVGAAAPDRLGSVQCRGLEVLAQIVRVWRALLGRSEVPLRAGEVEVVSEVPREDMHVVVPSVLVSGGLIVLS